MKYFQFLAFLFFLQGVLGNNQELRSFVEPVEGDLPSPCQFAESEQKGPYHDFNDLTILQPPPPLQSYPAIDMNPCAQNPPPIQYYENQLPTDVQNPPPIQYYENQLPTDVQNPPPIQYYENQLPTNVQNPPPIQYYENQLPTDNQNPPPIQYYENQLPTDNQNMNNNMNPYDAPHPFENIPPLTEDNYIYPDTNFEDPGYELQCDLEVCTQKCREYFHKETAIGSCEADACYCKERDVNEDPFDPETANNPTTKPSKRPWTHESQKEWPDSYPSCGKGLQSPINLKPEDFKDYTKKIKFYNFELPVSFFALNTGNGVRYLLQSSKYLMIGSNSFWRNQKSPKNYTLSHIDLHWPYEEHSINNVKSGVMEMQLYFFDSSEFWHYEAANRKKGGNYPSVMALSLIFRLNNENTDIDNELIKVLDDLKHDNKVGGNLPSKPYLEFIPKKMNYRFGSYEGTHTTPPCLKGLQWLINQPTRDNYYISTNQLHTLQNVRDHRGERIISNVRNVQK